MIAFSDEFSAENFIADIFTMPSFFLEPGFQSWDPSGWSVATGFRSKWSMLFANVDFRIA